MTTSLAAKIVEKQLVGKDIYGFTIETQEKINASAGAHIDVHLPSGLVRQYSLTKATSDISNEMEIAVYCDENGRGGSSELCHSVNVGDNVHVSTPRNNFELELGKQKYILLAGGIGMTPLLSMARELYSSNIDFEFHICAKSSEYVPFKAELDSGPLNKYLYYHYSLHNQRLDIDAFLTQLDSTIQVYCCGPATFLENIRKSTSHWPPKRIRMEHFSHEVEVLSDADSGTFNLMLNKSGLQLTVPEDKSILEVLNEAKISTASACLEGVCGTCVVNVIDGDILHRDACLYDDEKEANSMVATCVSRAKPGTTLVLDL